MVVCEEAIEGSEDLELAIEGVCDIVGVEDLELTIDGDCRPGEPLRGESMLNLLRLGSRDGMGALDRVTILIPLLVLVLAGMNRVAWLFGAGTAMR